VDVSRIVAAMLRLVGEELFAAVCGAVWEEVGGVAVGLSARFGRVAVGFQCG
jgi:hypothetical protein